MRMQASTLLALALVALAIVAVATLPVRAAMPQPGSAAPTVPVLASVVGGSYEPFDLGAASTGKAIVLYFFPEAFTAD